MDDTTLIIPTVSVAPELAIIAQSSGLEITKSQKLLQMFTPYFQRMGEIEAKIDLIDVESPSKEDVGIAREIRLALRSNRTASEKVKDDCKTAILVEGRLIDNLNNVVKNTSKLLESKCEAIEKHAEIQEKKRQDDLLAHRWPELKVYLPEGSNQAMFSLGTMDEEQYQTMLSGYRLVHEQRLEATRKAEEERLAREKAEAEERARIKADNDRLRKEAEEHERKLTEERERAKKEQQEIANQAAAEAARIRREASIAKVDQDRRLKEEREAREKAEAEVCRREAEAKIAAAAVVKAEKEAAERAEAEKQAKLQAEREAAMAPDRDKLALWISSFSIPAAPMAAASFDTGVGDIVQKFKDFKLWAQQQIDAVKS